MGRNTGISLAFVLLLGVSGCGTSQNLGVGVPGGHPPQVYGGVSIACYTLSHEMQPFLAWITFIFDLPLSLVGDTVTLPVTLVTSAAGKSTPAPPPPPSKPHPDDRTSVPTGQE